MRLKNRVCVVTGGGSGIGRAICNKFAEEGARVSILDLDEKGGNEVMKELRDGGAEALFFKTDVTKSDQCKAAIDGTAEKFGTIDVLVNNAGLQHVAPITEFPEEKWQLLINVMLSGAFYCTKHALPYMLPKKSGRIINMSSIHGLIGIEYKSAYVTAKHGLIGLTKVTAIETAESGITANAICPTFVRTPLVEKQIDDQAKSHGIPREEVMEKIIFGEAPMKRLVEPEEVAELAVYLAGDMAKNISGAALPMDETWTAR